MEYALVVLIQPSLDATDRTKTEWRGMQSHLQSLSQSNATLELMNESTVCCDVSQGSRCLVLVLSACVDRSVPYRLLFFEETPSWVVS